MVLKLVPTKKDLYGEDTLERAKRESQFLGAVNSPYVASALSELIQLDDEDETVVWTEEYLSGQDLDEVLTSRGFLSPAEVSTLLANVAGGLAACHEVGVVHRDLSWRNIRMTNEGVFVIMDPGYAKHLNRTNITGMYHPGSVGFLSPEHLPGRKIFPASDIFCLGILGYRAAYGCLPIEGNGDQYFRDLDDSAPLIIPAYADEGIRDVLRRCLQRQPARRYLDGTEMVEDLTSRSWGKN